MINLFQKVDQSQSDVEVVSADEQKRLDGGIELELSQNDDCDQIEVIQMNQDDQRICDGRDDQDEIQEIVEQQMSQQDGNEQDQDDFDDLTSISSEQNQIQYNDKIDSNSVKNDIINELQDHYDDFDQS